MGSRDSASGGCKTRPTGSVNSDESMGDLPIGRSWRPAHAGRMPNYRRAWVPGGTYFFTVNLLERRRTLLVDRVDVLRRSFAAVRATRPFDIIAIVILPDHLHCIWQLPPDDDDHATRWRHIKTAFVKQMPRGERRSLRRHFKAERGIWQRRYWEHLIRDERDLRNYIDYIHFNPVKHRYVSQVRDWPHSSFHRLVREGDLSADWSGEATDMEG
jgi:putative transposase